MRNEQFQALCKMTASRQGEAHSISLTIYMGVRR